VTVHAITTDNDQSVFAILNRKIADHATMQNEMRRAAICGDTHAPPKMNPEIRSEVTPRWTAHHGDCVRVARTLADDSIGFSIFSPPFADLFTYSDDIQDMGNCTDLDAFMKQFDFLVRELFRVTMPGRECAVHCCDLLSTKWKDGDIQLKDFSGRIKEAFRFHGWKLHSVITIWKSPVTEMQRTKAHGLLYKTLRADSSNSRVGAPDYLLVFRKPGVNPHPISHTPDEFPLDLWQEIASPVWMTINQGNVLNGAGARDQGDERHICPLQLDVIDRAVMLWSAPDDLVFSPFMGIGSEGYGALKRGRRFVGSELKESYWEQGCSNCARGEDMSRTLFNQPVIEAA